MEADFKWLSKNQYQSDYSDQSQQEQTAATWESFLKAREKSRVQIGIGFDFAPHWLKTWRKIFKPIAVA